MPGPTKLVETNRLVCQCPISYHVEMRNGRGVHVLDGELPTLADLCWGRCERCGLPFHTEFSGNE